MAQEELWKWIENGCQRKLVATQLYKPMTSVELCRLCQVQNPSILPQDVYAILRDMHARGIVQILNEKHRKGRLCL